MPKKIVVFADGTGNAFTTQESNVWRLYQALDWSRKDQISRYIKGVGTSGFRPLALIDGATGIGVPANVRKLYRFICWTWEEGDEIYMFGFSRGAFTIRSLIGLINSEGLAPAKIDGAPISNAQMRRNSLAAWRNYRAETVPWKKSLPTIWITRWIRDACLAVYNWAFRRPTYATVRQETGRQDRLNVRIKFVGLFDTVEAYGVPFEELRSAIDWAIWPISFRNRVLSNRVDCARHALSLDDERTTFHPVRFDMSNETTDRIKEVWFAGVHSDVGGGYPENSLAHVPLVWIAEAAELATTDASGKRTPGLRFRPGLLDKFRAKASALGPLHDSRGGLSVLYRYSPRPIVENEETRGAPVIHHSVTVKMAFGSENYAPVTLPSTARVLMPDGSTPPIHGFSRERNAPTAGQAWSEDDPQMSMALAAVHKLSDPDKELVSLTRDAIWWRRIAYVALVFSVTVAALLPYTAYLITDAVQAGIGGLGKLVGLGHWWQAFWDYLANSNAGLSAILHSVSKTVGGFLPDYAKYWIDVVVARPYTSAGVFLAVFGLYKWNSALRDFIANRARLAWFTGARDALSIAKPRGAETARKGGLMMDFARFMRKSSFAGGLSLVSRIVLPGAALILFLAATLVTVSRTTVAYKAGAADLFCEPSKEPLRRVEDKPLFIDGFEIDKLCWASGVRLAKGAKYTIWIEMAEPFFDQTIMADIGGFRDHSLRYLAALPIRRWWAADWLQPIARIGKAGDVEWPLQAIDGAEALQLGLDADGNPRSVHFYEMDDDAARLAGLDRREAAAKARRLGWCDKIPAADVAAANQNWNRQNFRKIYVSQFVASDEGELFLYVNDAIAAIPFGPTIDCFYANNRGKARVTIERARLPEPYAIKATTGQ